MHHTHSATSSWEPLQRRLASGKVGILLSNLGTPDGTDYRSVRRYLAEFLSDTRVIELPKLVWQPILQGVVLLRRPAVKGKDYARIWNHELDESPLKTVTRSQAAKLHAWASEMFGEDRVAVDWGMRYGNPSIEDAVKRLTALGCDRLLMFPLYPQYSATTTATANDKLFDILRGMRNQPAARVVPSYFDEPAYIEALARSVRGTLAGLDEEPEVVVASFHGIPQRNVALGDPYYVQCQRTGELLRDALGLPATRFRISYQSRFGYADWLQPYTEATMRELARDGIRRIAVISPGFAADCIETIDEIGRENAHYFREAGGEAFTLIPCLNDSEDGMAVLRDRVLQETRGWL
ncbi:ferrochelatase [Luteibacter rhizovicinus DSM 16549]|uniref:Ferrochelatase n=1 Tax=Luteibacter rhizovicinus DSM 16549 TaxID=1440763 RepID=A0A0G9H6I1_9GAMM|nr:ferrochelatase [Luteibacter rhizovicinus]APG05136.1 ferrochelatase [Luteibacter rhizovicinus DSM 16549]KLD65153.1 ferrochelatase [Luteibacter rhizovicinus DSM 16549]KLD77121.1 ferrochelatase [Xanthomonas hyacinthi DSM 19077]